MTYLSVLLPDRIAIDRNFHSLTDSVKREFYQAQNQNIHLGLVSSVSNQVPSVSGEDVILSDGLWIK
jgi:hypothetical protein